MTIKIDIISGFLGAGKTTLIKKIVSEEYKNEKVVVIENEFGRVNIDGEVLKDSGVIVQELVGGCICCSLYGSFDSSIIEVIDKFNPQRIIIEPTGIAMLTEILNNVKELRTTYDIEINFVATVVDVNRFKFSILCSKEFIENQIRAAGNIILSKTSSASAGVIDEVVRQILEIDAGANVINLEWNKVSAKDIINGVFNKSKQDITLNMKKSIKNKRSLRNNIKVKLAVEKSILPIVDSSKRFSSYEIEINSNFDKQRLDKVFRLMQNELEYGKILRGKGILKVNDRNWYKFDYVPGELLYENLNSEFIGKVCIIGINLNKISIGELFS